jgi:hypothetical protein
MSVCGWLAGRFSSVAVAVPAPGSRLGSARRSAAHGSALAAVHRLGRAAIGPGAITCTVRGVGSLAIRAGSTV